MYREEIEKILQEEFNKFEITKIETEGNEILAYVTGDGYKYVSVFKIQEDNTLFADTLIEL